MNTFQTTRSLSAEQTIRQLAARHQISHQHSALDHLGDTITQLVDEDVHVDETQWLLVELGRADMISDRAEYPLCQRMKQGSSVDQPSQTPTPPINFAMMVEK